MAWEQRGKNQYFYRKQRIGNRVVSKYLGRGKTAEMLSEIDEGRRLEKQIDRQIEHRTYEAFKEASAEIDRVCDLLEILTEGLLLATGHYNHKGEWRRKRNGTQSGSPQRNGQTVQSFKNVD